MFRKMASLILVGLMVGPLQAQSDKRAEKIKASVDRALEFLQKQQGADGSWRLNQAKSTGVSSLAIMAFLSAGHVPGEGPYGETVKNGIRWVLKSQKDNGLIFFGKTSNAYQMYEHGISTLMLAEVTGMTKTDLSPQIKTALEKAVKLILQAQKTGGAHKGGWRYRMADNYDSDLSVTGWQLLALRAAQNIGCDVPAEPITMAVDYVKRCQDKSSGGFRYQINSRLTIPCTGTGVLCLELCDKHHNQQALRAGGYLLHNPPQLKSVQSHFYYNLYYGSQAMFQLGGNYWNVYRAHLHNVLFELQKSDGSWGRSGYKPGYTNHGFVYSTSMSVLALTVEYRYLPIYQRPSDSD